MDAVFLMILVALYAVSHWLILGSSWLRNSQSGAGK